MRFKGITGIPCLYNTTMLYECRLGHIVLLAEQIAGSQALLLKNLDSYIFPNVLV